MKKLALLLTASLAFVAPVFGADADLEARIAALEERVAALEAQIGDRTYYYPVTLPESQRNRTYLIEEAVIRTLGSLDPEKDQPGSIEVTFRTSTEDWSPAYTVTETS